MALKNAKAKGARAEHRTMRVLRAAGYFCLRASGSLGCFDVVAIGPGDTRCIQVKAGTAYCSGVEREQLQLLQLPPMMFKEIWRWPDRCRAPLIERL